MAVSVTIANVLANGGAPSSGNNVTASWTPGTTKQYLLAITSYVSTGSASPVISSITGNGLTWTLIDTIQPDSAGADRTTLHLYAARGGGGSAGTTTIAWSTAPTRASWSIDEVTNGDIGLGVATLPQADASGTVLTGNPSATLGSALKSGSVTYAAAAFESSAGTLSAGSGYTALANVATQSLAWLLTEWDSAGSTTASASNSTTTNRHGIILVEIACAQFAHVGSTLTWDTGNPTLTPTNVGDIITVCEVTKLASTPMITGLSSSNVTWTRLTPDFATSTAATPTGAAIWIGKVTSTSAATVTITWAGGSEPAHWEAAVNEFQSVFPDWELDVYGTIDSNSNTSYPSLTPTGPGELYVGIHYDDTGAVVGSTAGYTYEVTSHGNGALYNPACTSSAQAPTWGGGTVMGGIAALIKQLTVAGTADVTLKKMSVSGSGYAAISPLVQEGVAAQTLSPSFHKATQAGNLLVAWLGSNDSGASPPFSTTSPGWVIAFQAGGAFQWFAVAYKENCSAGETAPTFSDSGGSEPFSKLAEFSGMALSSVLDQTGGASASGTSFSAQASAGDSQSGDLIIGGVYCNSPSIVATASATMTDSSGASVTVYEGSGQPGGAGTILYDFVWGVAGGTTGSSGDEVVVTTSAFTGGTAGIASFKTPSSGVTGTSSVTLKKMTVAGTATAPLAGTANVTLKKMSVSGSNVTIYTVWNDVLPDAGTAQTAAGQRNDSLVFEVTSDCTLEGIAFYVPSGSGATDGTTYTAALYTTVTGMSGTLVTSQAGSGTFTAGAWNWIPLNVDLTTGTWYSAVINSPNDLQYEHNWWGTGPGASGFVVGPISVPSQAAAPGNIQQGFGNGTLFMPNAANANGSWYGIDVKVSTAAGPGSDSGTADVTLKKMTIAVTGDVFDKGTSAAVLRKMTVSATGHAPVAGTAAVKLKKMTTFGSGKAKISGTISVSLRKMTTSGFGFAPVFGTAVVVMPKMQVHASDHVPEASPLFLFSLF